MDITKLRHVAQLAQDRHFGRAADRMGLTQSALTRSIQALEAELGLRLFDRGREGVQLTRAGEAFLDDARQVLRQMDALERNMALLANRETGEVHCGLGPMAASLVLPDVLARIVREQQPVRMRTRLGGVAELLDLLHEGELDFALLAHPLVKSRAKALTIRRIGQTRLGALVRPGHPLAGRTVTQGDVEGFPTIGGTNTAYAVPDNGAPYAPSIACDNFEIARAVTLASDAIWITAECLANGELAPVHGLPIAQPITLVAASLARRTMAPSAIRVIEMMTDALRRQDASASPSPSSPSDG